MRLITTSTIGRLVRSEICCRKTLEIIDASIGALPAPGASTTTGEVTSEPGFCAGREVSVEMIAHALSGGTTATVSDHGPRSHAHFDAMTGPEGSDFSVSCSCEHRAATSTRSRRLSGPMSAGSLPSSAVSSTIPATWPRDAGRVRPGVAQPRTFRGDAAVSTWLFRIATNAALMRACKRSHRFVNLDDAVGDPCSSSTPMIWRSGVSAERVAAVRAALARLPVDQRARCGAARYRGLLTPEAAGSSTSRSPRSRPGCIAVACVYGCCWPTSPMTGRSAPSVRLSRWKSCPRQRSGRHRARPQFERRGNRSGAAAYTELAVDVVEVLLHRAWGDEQLGADRGVGRAGDDEVHDVSLAWAEGEGEQRIDRRLFDPMVMQHDGIGLDIAGHEAGQESLAPRSPRGVPTARWDRPPRCGTLVWSVHARATPPWRTAVRPAKGAGRRTSPTDRRSRWCHRRSRRGPPAALGCRPLRPEPVSSSDRRRSRSHSNRYCCPRIGRERVHGVTIGIGEVPGVAVHGETNHHRLTAGEG